TALAQNGQEALDLFEQSGIGEFDIILMDMQMPVMDGCTAASSIRKLDRADAGTVVIYACTANMFQEDREQALASGMNDFLTKPIDVDVLLKKLRKNEK
ncbi:MAG: response regulator, partial [Butyrivibrio sp.]|nr:response regulator [Butyrivibrio sp.]